MSLAFSRRTSPQTLCSPAAWKQFHDTFYRLVDRPSHWCAERCWAGTVEEHCSRNSPVLVGSYTG